MLVKTYTYYLFLALHTERREVNFVKMRLACFGVRTFWHQVDCFIDVDILLNIKKIQIHSSKWVHILLSYGTTHFQIKVYLLSDNISRLNYLSIN